MTLTPRRIGGGITVVSAYAHIDVARKLVHRLKYSGIAESADVFATALARQIPPGTGALVPVPRSTLRRIRYGIDPAMALARALRLHTGVPVAPVLRPALWWPAHAGSQRTTRRTPKFVVSGPIPRGSVLVDDVLTTGATLSGASRVTGIHTALTATRAGRDVAG